MQLSIGELLQPWHGHVVETKDFIFERNFIQFDARGPGIKYAYFGLDGGNHTIRNNVIDLQGSQSSSIGGHDDFRLVFAYGDPGAASSGSAPGGNVHVYNNTIFNDDAYSDDIRFIDENLTGGNSGCPSGCMSRNNLVVWPNYTGDTTPNDATPVTSSNNLVLTSEVFVATVPEIGLTQIDDFRLAAASSPIDAGYDFVAGTDTDRWVYKDTGSRCRTAVVDAGAGTKLYRSPCTITPKRASFFRLSRRMYIGGAVARPGYVGGL